MCKCEKKVENENEVAVGVVMGIVDLLDEIFGDAANETKKWENSVDLDKEIDHVMFNDPATIVFWKPLYDLHRRIFRQFLSNQYLVYRNRQSIYIFLHQTPKQPQQDNL